MAYVPTRMPGTRAATLKRLIFRIFMMVMKKLLTAILIAGFALVIWTGCKKESEVFASGTIADYYPLRIGSNYLYRLDSTIPAPFGSSLIVHSYQAKDSVEAAFTDNQGRKSYRIFRTIRDTAGLQAWRFAATYVATPANNGLEYVDNNMRFVKLRLPIVEGYTWKAHGFIDTKSINSNVTFLDEWEYAYGNVEQPYTIFNKRYDTTVTVFQHDETSPPGPFDPNNYQQRNFGIEVYAKGVGLVYKDFLHWTYQTTPPPAKYEDGSYGVRLRLINYY